MDITYKALDELIPYAQNAKTHDDTQIKNLALSLDKYGWKQPVVIDRNNVIVAGHGRVLAAKNSRKWRDKPVPCVVADDLTDEQIKEFRLVDNKSAESEWDMDALMAELPELDLGEFEFEWGLRDELSDGVVEDGYVPELPERPKARKGDIYQLGGAQTDVRRQHGARGCRKALRRRDCGLAADRPSI